MLADQVELGSLILLCGRYEGIDERLIQQEVDEEWSLGDYVISGGELAAMVCIDAITRLLPGALGHDESAQQDSLVRACWIARTIPVPRIIGALAYHRY